MSPRTVRRDIDRLRRIGYPVEAAEGTAGGYRLVAGGAMPPLLLDDEAVAVTLGLRAAAGHSVEGMEEASVEGMEEASVGAMAKLERVLPARLRHRVESLDAATAPLMTRRRAHRRFRAADAGRDRDLGSGPPPLHLQAGSIR